MYVKAYFCGGNCRPVDEVGSMLCPDNKWLYAGPGGILYTENKLLNDNLATLIHASTYHAK